MTKPIKAYGQPYLTIYLFDDDSKEARSGGTPAWRNNNPGNLRSYPFSYRHGAIGEANDFAIFPDVQTGIDAQIALLKTNTYRNFTLAEAIAYYADREHNPTDNYIAHVVAETGIPAGRSMAELDDEELMTVLLAMRRFEDYKIGDIKIIDKPGYVDGDGKMLQYIWRTRGDSKTRMSHRIREGAVFRWENPPPGGHPGEDYNCRCWAEEIAPKKAMKKVLPRLHAHALQWG